MSVTPTSFRQAFPEFSNTTSFPDAQISFWIGQAVYQLGSYVFGDPTSPVDQAAANDLATMLYVAFNIVQGAQNASVSASGAAPGSATGVVASKTVGPVSVSYDTSAAAVAGAGIWNINSYGRRLYAMMQAYALGPLYVPGSRAVRRRYGLAMFGNEDN